MIPLDSPTIGHLIFDDSFVENKKSVGPFLEHKKRLGIPLPENRKVAKLPFHVFNRYEIHIQAFVNFINGKVIIFQSSSPPKYFENMYSQIHEIRETQKKYGT